MPGVPPHCLCRSDLFSADCRRSGLQLPECVTPGGCIPLQVLPQKHFTRDRISPHYRKLRFNEKLTPRDVSELERILLEAGTGTRDDIERAEREGLTLGLFLRSLVGLDREAAKDSLDGFLQAKLSQPIRSNSLTWSLTT